MSKRTTAKTDTRARYTAEALEKRRQAAGISYAELAPHINKLEPYTIETSHEASYERLRAYDLAIQQVLLDRAERGQSEAEPVLEASGIYWRSIRRSMHLTPEAIGLRGRLTIDQVNAIESTELVELQGIAPVYLNALVIKAAEAMDGPGPYEARKEERLAQLMKRDPHSEYIPELRKDNVYLRTKVDSLLKKNSELNKRIQELEAALAR
jgi:hypothetical protein